MNRGVSIEAMNDFIFVEDSNTKKLLASFPITDGYSDIISGITDLIESFDPNCNIDIIYK